jgi:hypothetical protein
MSVEKVGREKSDGRKDSEPYATLGPGRATEG